MSRLHKQVSYGSNVETDRTQIASAVVNIPTTTQSKLDSASNLLDMLSLDDPSEIGEGLSSADDNSWANFQCRCFSVNIKKKLVILHFLKNKPFGIGEGLC